MSPRCYPPESAFGEDRRAERTAWEALRDQLPDEAAEFFAAESVFYGHVLGFKGLERSAVVLAVDGLRDESRAKEMLYVGLSRARTQLVVWRSRLHHSIGW